MGELVIGIILIIISITFYVTAGGFPALSDAPLQAGSFPQFIAVLLGFLSLIFVLIKAKELAGRKSGSTQESMGDKIRHFYEEHRLVLITLVSLVLYIILMQLIGFVITTIVFIVVTGYIIGPKKKKDLLILSAVAVVVTLSAFFFFENVLYVRFPSGLLF
ncbi:tripartite tricarboxylate transporter TctB family protein [Indiicoccus explosivorum]|uniref:tripartite tricarboxylate transporter TctB family protein n=1 Tax=Indiicoccus explosivorum TaxID=1917864 RepID=UPI00138FED66|nr:tripartite tricarboxylate transporter TctB family protein [Indiicoccus explosivorum]